MVDHYAAMCKTETRGGVANSYAPINVNPVGGGGGVRARGGVLMPETIPMSGF